MTGSSELKELTPCDKFIRIMDAACLTIEKLPLKAGVGV